MTLRPLFLGVGTLAVGFLLAGCGQHSAVDKPTVIAAKGVSGRVHGGQNPVTGATIQLWQVNTTTDGGLGKPLLLSTVTSSDGSGVANANANLGNAFNTLPSGEFTLTGLYTCPVGDALVYITASGGNPGLSAGTNNPQSQMVTALGSCNNLKTNVQFVEIDEQTTVATVASLYAFMSAYNAIGAAPAHAADLAFAFSQMNEYVDFQAATAPGPALPANYSASTGDLNLLANVLATCVNSAGGAYKDGSPCGTLFYYASPSSTNPSTDVTGAALYTRKTYTANVGPGYVGTLPTPQAPFQPASTTSPRDWTLPIFQLPSTPMFSLSSGTYTSTQQVRILDADPDALIYYSFNAASPSTEGPIYHGAITVGSNETINAFAVSGAGRAISPVGSATYTITGLANAPTVRVPYTLNFGSTATESISVFSNANGSVVTFSASGSLGGSFSPTTCTVSGGGCNSTYTPTGSAPPGAYTTGIKASFTASGSYPSATAYGTVEIIPPDTLTPLAAGNDFQNSLVQASDGYLYGVQQNSNGNISGLDQIFKIDLSGKVTPIYNFTDPANGLYIADHLVQGTDGFFYGVAQLGGSSGNGTIFKVDSSGNLTLLYTFTGSLDGAQPYRALVQGTDGSFYGTTQRSGADNFGTVFKIDSSGNFTLLHGFAAGTDGAYPFGSLVQGADGDFYGTTNGGGTSNAGTIFKMDPSGDVTTLYSFTGGMDGLIPYTGLVQATDGNFYGTNIEGGAFGSGTLFKIDAAGNFTTVHNFQELEGQDTEGALVQASDDALYGTASIGGDSGYGTLYKIDTAGNFTLLYQFMGSSDGADPTVSLLQASDGALYGANYSNFFKLTPSPALTGPVTLTVPASVTHGTGFTLSYTVANAASKTMQQCFATNTAGDLTGWTGIKTASTSATNASLFAPLIAGTYTYSLTCGGVESGFATLNVN